MPNRESAAGRHARLPDPELIAACLRGDADAWDALIHRYEGLIFTCAVRQGLSRADAEDVFQDVCVLLLNHLGDLRDTGRLAGWLTSTTKREAWRLRRRRGPSLTSELVDREWELEGAERLHAADSPSPEDAAIALEDQHLVQQALQRLPDRCRTLLTLLYGEDPPRPYAEIAQRLSLPLGSIGPHRARCLQRLHKILAELDF